MTITATPPLLAPLGQIEVRDLTETGDLVRSIEGLAVPYDVWTETGWYREMIAPGAFAKSIREAGKRLPLLLWHESRAFPVGVSRSWRDTPKGLLGVWDLDVEDERAMGAGRKARDGFLTGLSVGFQPIISDRTYHEDTGVLDIVRKEGRLLEVSLVATPAYQSAQVQLVRKSRGTPRLDNARQYLNMIR